MGDSSSLLSQVSACLMNRGNDYLLLDFFEHFDSEHFDWCLTVEQRASRLIAHYKSSQFPKPRFSPL